MPDLHGFQIKELVAMSSPAVRSRNVLKRNSMRFAAALLAALASFVAGPNAALAAAPQHHDQVPGFYRLKVGDRSEEHTSELQSPCNLVCRLLLEKKKH